MAKVGASPINQAVERFRDIDFSKHEEPRCPLRVHLVDVGGPGLLVAITIAGSELEPIYIDAFEAKTIAARLSAAADELIDRLADRCAT